jgi:transcriptional regulator with XRE-family HTH domain
MSSPAALHQVLAVLIEAADAAVLHRVLAVLLEQMEPMRQTAVLRAVIVELLNTSAEPSQPAVKRPAAAQRQSASSRGAAQRAEAPSPANSQWAELRPRLRACMARGVSEQELAAALGIAPSTLHRALTGVRRGPSAAVMARATAWLAAQDSQRTPGNESPDRLSTEQRERLAFLAQHDQSEIRREAHVTRAQLEQAVAGEALDPAVVLRLVDLLSGRPSSSFPKYPT